MQFSIYIDFLQWDKASAMTTMTVTMTVMTDGLFSFYRYNSFLILVSFIDIHAFVFFSILYNFSKFRKVPKKKET